jgi:hypothetical protein
MELNCGLNNVLGFQEFERKSGGFAKTPRELESWQGQQF